METSRKVYTGTEARKKAIMKGLMLLSYAVLLWVFGEIGVTIVIIGLVALGFVIILAALLPWDVTVTEDK